MALEPTASGQSWLAVELHDIAVAFAVEMGRLADASAGLDSFGQLTITQDGAGVLISVTATPTETIRVENALVAQFSASDRLRVDRPDIMCLFRIQRKI
ncbi:MAG: hypothetical protein R3D27_03005 [Hyphomicrobiaceae bacterium]